MITIQCHHGDLLVMGVLSAHILVKGCIALCCAFFPTTIIIGFVVVVVVVVVVLFYFCARIHSIH